MKNIPGLEYAQHRMVITGLYIVMNDEQAVKRLIRRWRRETGVDDPVKENLLQRVIRRWKGEPRKKRGEIRCVVEMDKDQMVYTAHFF